MKKADGRSHHFNIGICSCGQCVLSTNSWISELQCDKCGNSHFVDARGQHRERFVIPILEVLRKDNRGFKIKRINLSVKYTEDEGVKAIKENLVRTIDYDIVDKTLKVWRKDELEYDFNQHKFGRVQELVNQYFFTQLDEDLFISAISNEVTRGLYKVAKQLGNRGWGRKRSMLLGLSKLMNEWSWMQILASAGIPSVDRFYTTRRARLSNDIDEGKTKPHEILKVPKFMIKYIREHVSIDIYVLSNLQSCVKNIDSNKFKEIMSIVKDESNMRELSNSIELFMQIHIDYDYKNIKKLILYLFREVRLTQGISSPRDACTYLRDYIRMSRAMNLEWEKYPKSLKKVHDVVQMNYNLLNKDETKKREFELAVNKKSYQDLLFKDKKDNLAIISPKATDDLVREGNQLSHCVASYVTDVANDKCKILFLRKLDEADKPLATIEVRGLNIRQARGFANKPLDKDGRRFVKKWAEEKGLVEAYY